MSVIQAQNIESANEHFFLNMERHTVPAINYINMNLIKLSFTILPYWNGIGISDYRPCICFTELIFLFSYYEYK